MTTKVLRLIGKGQVTVPQEWRAILGVESKVVKATLKGSTMIIEALPLAAEKTWDTEVVHLNSLPETDRALVKEGRKAYKQGKKEKFMTANEFFKR